MRLACDFDNNKFNQMQQQSAWTGNGFEYLLMNKLLNCQSKLFEAVWAMQFFLGVKMGFSAKMQIDICCAPNVDTCKTLIKMHLFKVSYVG